MRMGEAAVGATLPHNAAVPAQQDRLVFGELQCKEGIMLRVWWRSQQDMMHRVMQ